jgi:hypothetical protein
LFQPKDSEISEIFFFPSANLTNLARFCKEKIQILYITKLEGGEKKIPQHDPATRRKMEIKNNGV